MLEETGWIVPVQILPKDEGQYWLHRPISLCLREIGWMLFGFRICGQRGCDNYVGYLFISSWGGASRPGCMLSDNFQGAMTA
jgi:hypothetical protein